ncbi:cytochrome P450 [Streptomyces sp. NPDC048278]|uniref:cytochrome P450 n=1 Tax=Streptomyces sp. NPDC048278 TaxID=3155809 RepID=UPI00344ABA50
MTVNDVRDYPFDQPKALEAPPEWAAARGCPVTHVRTPSGDVVGLVAGYDEARTLLSDPRFNRRLDREGAARTATTEDGGMYNRENKAMSELMGEGHRRYRRLISPAFTVKKMEAWRPRVQRMADDLLDAVLAKGAPVELRSEFALPLPVGVICALLGAPAEDEDKFSHWSEVMMTTTKYTQEEVDEARTEFVTYAAALVAEKRANPGEDLLSELTQISDSEDGRLSGEELIQTAVGVLIAGHETTSNAIIKMTALLLADRALYEAVVEDPSLVPGAVEESLRLDPVGGLGIPRFIYEDIEVGGERVPAGTTLFVNLSAADRDERKFPEPERFDATRPNAQQHLAFSAGPRFCIGQTLARVELQVVLDTFVRRLPGLRLRDTPDDLRIRTGVVATGLEELWVTW